MPCELRRLPGSTASGSCSATIRAVPRSSSTSRRPRAPEGRGAAWAELGLPGRARSTGTAGVRPRSAGSQPLERFRAETDLAGRGEISPHVAASTGMPRRAGAPFLARSGSPATSTRSTPRPAARRVPVDEASASRARCSAVPSRCGSTTIDEHAVQHPAPRRRHALAAVAPPVSAPPSSSQTSARPEPLCSPNVSSAPNGSTTV